MKSKFHIGMRNIKTALAVLVCLFIYQYYPGNVSYTCITAVIAMQATLQDTLQQSRNRAFGTIIGGVFGGLFLYLDTYLLLHPLLRILLISVGITIFILICNLIQLQDTIVMGCVTYLAIVLGDLTQSAWLYSLNRVIDTLIGILIAVSINYFIRPPKSTLPDEAEDEEAQLPEEASGDSNASDSLQNN